MDLAWTHTDVRPNVVRSVSYPIIIIQIFKNIWSDRLAYSSTVKNFKVFSVKDRELLTLFDTVFLN